jgi:hypothetical protein
MFYYKYSDLIPGVLTFTGSYGEQSSRYLGIPTSDFSIWNYSILKYKEFIILFAITGCIIGFVLGLIFCKISPKNDEEKIHKKWSPISIDDYYNKQENQHFLDERIPKCIEDYYKKTK